MIHCDAAVGHANICMFKDVYCPIPGICNKVVKFPLSYVFGHVKSVHGLKVWEGKSPFRPLKLLLNPSTGRRCKSLLEKYYYFGLVK
jgi:hypothetical protein